MVFKRTNLINGVGRRLRQLRQQFKCSLEDMARKLELSKSGYYKNEGGLSFPGLDTLDILQRNFDISMDWLIFNKGPVHFKEREPDPRAEPEKVGEKETPDLGNISGDLRELLEYMDHDRLLKYEVLVYFYKYREKKEKQVLTAPPAIDRIQPVPEESDG